VSKQVIQNYVYFSGPDSFGSEAYYPIELLNVEFPTIKHFLLYVHILYSHAPEIADQVSDLSLVEIEQFEELFPRDPKDSMYRIIEEQALLFATWQKFRTYPNLVTELKFYDGCFLRGPTDAELRTAQAIHAVRPHVGDVKPPEFILDIEFNLRQSLLLPHISTDN
jgi:hypothetical protein